MPETLFDIFFRTAERLGEKGALVPKIDGVFTEVSYAKCAETITDFAYGLHKLGVAKGDKVAILSENRPEWVFSDLALFALGGVTVPIYATLSAKQVEYILNDSHSKILVISQPECLDMVNKIFNNLKDLKRVITLFKPEEDVLQITHCYEDIIEEGKTLRSEEPELLQERRRELDGTDLATIVYTSGTTGKPKGAMLTHSNFISNIKMSLEVIKIKEDDILLSFLPICHVFERMAGYYMPLYVGCTIAYAESIQAVSDNMREVRPTIMMSVPRLYEKMYNLVQDSVAKGSFIKKLIFKWCLRAGKKHYVAKKKGKVSRSTKFKYSVAEKLVFRKLKERTGGRIRFFVSGGAPLTKEIGEFFAYAGITILEGYGLTETSPVIAANPLEDCRIGTVGKPIPGIEVKIAEDGEICTRGPHIMKGYYNNPEATKEVIDDDGWFHTGDIGFIDDDGYITITDRKKNLIVTSGGKNIAPQMIENLMATSRYIEQIVMFGDLRQFPSALIVPSFENLEDYFKAENIPFSSRKELVDHPAAYQLIESEIKRLSVDLSNYEIIKKFIVLEHEFTQENDELTPTLKVKRNVVEKKYAKEIEKMYSV